MSQDMESALDRAVMESVSTYKDADKSPVDHGHAFLKGIDGRTKLATAMRDHQAIDVVHSDYHGTIAYVDGLDRYATARRGAYDVFTKVLQAEGVDGAQDLSVWCRRD